MINFKVNELMVNIIVRNFKKRRGTIIIMTLCNKINTRSGYTSKYYNEWDQAQTSENY